MAHRLEKRQHDKRLIVGHEELDPLRRLKIRRVYAVTT